MVGIKTAREVLLVLIPECRIHVNFRNLWQMDRATRGPARRRRLLEESSRFCQRLIDPRRVFAAAAGVVGLAAALAADNRGDLLDEFSGLDS